MQNLENEKLTWEAPRLISNNVNITESGSTTGIEGAHFNASSYSAS